MGRCETEKEREKYIFGRSRSIGIELGRQMLTEHKLNATKLQSEISILNKEKKILMGEVDSNLEEIKKIEKGVTSLETEMHKLNKLEQDNGAQVIGNINYELREQKSRLDLEFSDLITKLSVRKDNLEKLQDKVSTLEREKQTKYDDLKSLERKLVVLLEAQQTELHEIKRRQEVVHFGMKPAETNLINSAPNQPLWQGPSDTEKKKAAQLMESTETMMKFGFMSMSMTYFSSLNMVKAMKTVAAQDTVMAAVSKNENITSPQSLIYSEIPGTFSKNLDEMNGLKNVPHNQNTKMTSKNLIIDVQTWNVSDVSEWLSSLCLSQYIDSFRDGAVDGPFLHVITDDDLRYVLGVEHKLHRKKIIYSIDLLKRKQRTSQDNHHVKAGEDEDVGYSQINSFKESPSTQNMIIAELNSDEVKSQSSKIPSSAKIKEYLKSEISLGEIEPLNSKPSKQVILNMEELISWVRHQKYQKLKEGLDHTPNTRFDKTCLRVQFVEGYGTAYSEIYEREPFNLNKTDEFGNCLLHIAAQNGNIRIGKILVQKGANPNHQNKVGQTPGHFAVAYQFFDFASWLFNENGANANDELFNIYGLGPYDGLTNDD